VYEASSYSRGVTCVIVIGTLSSIRPHTLVA
jgi:hypothetical protein